MLGQDKILLIIIIVILIIFICYSLMNKPKKSKMENVSPYVMLGALRNEKKNVILVNVLGEKIPFLIDCLDSKNTLSFTKGQFEGYLKQNSLENTDLVVLYCASWSCGAAKNYFEELDTRGLDMSKIYDYKGALHEWAMYSLLFPEIFTMKNLTTNEDADKGSLLELSKSTKHTYLLKDEKNSSNKIIATLSEDGELIL
jgi:hypothetical protein